MKRFSQLVIPYIAWAVMMLILPMGLIALYSFTKQGNTIVSFTFTLEHYAKFFTDPDFLIVLWRSLLIAFKTTVICLLLGYPVAFFISRSSEKLQNILVLAITIPMWINMLVRTYAWIGLLSEGGLIQRLLGFFGIARGELLYTEGAVLLGMVYNFLPFMVLQINTALCKMDHSLLEASADLGANARQTFVRVALPMSLPGVINGITLVFLPAVSSFFIPKLLGGGQYFLIGNLIENQFITVGEWNFGSAISMIMAAVMMLLMMLVRKVEIQQPRRKGGVGDEKGKTFLWEDSDGTDTDLLLPSDRVYGHLFIQQRKVADQFFGIFSALVPAYDGIAHDDGVSVYDIQYRPDRDGDFYGCGYDLGDRPVKVKENRAESDGTGQ